MSIPTEQLPAAGFAPISTVCRFSTKSKPTIYRWVRLGLFPEPVRLGPNSVAWRVEDLRKWAEDPQSWKAEGAR